MDAVEFLKKGLIMCNSYEACIGCPMEQMDDCCMLSMNLKQMTSIVEQWAKEHLVKTRQSEFLKMWPEASVLYGEYLNICPAQISSECRDKETGGCYDPGMDCGKCKRNFLTKRN